MKLKKISFKNFKSYSNEMTEINMDDTSSLNLIVGENGTGKTSIAECITYLIYGKLDGFVAADIPNHYNKNFYGKLECECDGHLVTIERGLNPSVFRVEIDGKEIDTAGKNNVQEFLENNYIHIPFSVFECLLIVKVGELVSLLDMNNTEKKNIIDKICGFTIYNIYNKIVKEDMKSLNEKIYINSGILTSKLNALEEYNRQIQQINDSSITQEELDDLSNRINEAKKIKESYNDMITKIGKARESLNNDYYKNYGECKILNEKIAQIDKKIKLIDGGKCPTCGSSLDTEDFHAQREALINEKNEYISKKNTIIVLANKSKERIGILDKKAEEIKSKDNKFELINLQSDYKSKSELKNKSSQPIEALKNKIIAELDELNKEKKELDEEKKVLDVLNMIFGENGIKKYISSMYIPTINTLMASMMDYMNLNYTITFDSNFDATIMQSGGIKRKYRTLSSGEKQKVNFAAIIAFVKFLKLQFGELNLLFLDEVFAHVDVNGVSDMIDILKDLCKDMNLNIYLIHHARLENAAFDNILHTVKIDNFSHLEYI